jgi:hypothetical protein
LRLRALGNIGTVEFSLGEIMKFAMSLFLIATLVVASASSGFAQQAVNRTKQPTVKRRLATLVSEVATLTQQLNAAQGTIQFLSTELGSQAAQHAIALGLYVTTTDNTINGLRGPNIIFTGANIHVRSGSGFTVDGSGLGNLIVGYDEDEGAQSVDSSRSGSHNLVVGPGHQFTASGALLAGKDNTVISNFGSATGGQCNAVGDQAKRSSFCGIPPSLGTGEASSIVGGLLNMATGTDTVVLGGEGNEAIAYGSSISGGVDNAANGQLGSVLGGNQNLANGYESTVSGGEINTASGTASSIGGGEGNVASSTDQNIN